MSTQATTSVNGNDNDTNTRINEHHDEETSTSINGYNNDTGKLTCAAIYNISHNTARTAHASTRKPAQACTTR